MKISKEKIVALIPARSGSKRIRDKNIKLIHGNPLIAYNINSAIQSNIFRDIIVSTDSKKYKEIAEYYGANVTLRPKKYSGDNSPDIEWVSHILGNLNQAEKIYDYFAILRPTNSFRLLQIIKRAVNQFLKSKNADTLRAVEICS